MRLQALLLSLSTALLGSCDELPAVAVGQLESDRVELVAEVNEPITGIEVMEGDLLPAAAVLITQSMSRVDSRIDQARAAVQRQTARLAELVNGPRQEVISAMRARLREAAVEKNFLAREFERLTGLLARNLTSLESVDTAQMRLDSAVARLASTSAQLQELEAGSRAEAIAQARASLAEVESQLDGLMIDRKRHSISAPVPGIVDSLPFEVGERPRPGEVVAVLLTGSQPYARIFIPEPQRLTVRIGAELPVHVDGLEQTLTGTVRRISSEAAFTPYFALTERDRSRLSFVAELTLQETGTRLPEGLPVQVYFD